uniref:LRRNT domain-containing protein n=1 Tax=Ascaris lumbricoides TaxID=6252 RepID=A0A9J2P178_ASCLU
MFQCLDGCQCDTDDEAIHCHNGERTTLFLPENRLRGFSVIGITNNAISRLPTEAELKEKFPDLRAIDIEGNANFNCDSLKDYTTIKVYSNCKGEDTPTIIRGQRLPDIEQPTDTCNFQCQVKKHYKVLHEYLVRIWKMLKAKYDEMDKEKIVKDVQEFFIKLADKINKNLNDIQLRMTHGDSERPPTSLMPSDPTGLLVSLHSFL